MSTRARLITTQATIVGILVVVVYAIFLSPNGDEPLTGIETPVSPRPQQQPAKDDGDDRKKVEGGQQQEPTIAPPPPSPPEGFTPPTPTDFEYDGSVAQLRNLLRAADQ